MEMVSDLDDPYGLNPGRHRGWVDTAVQALLDLRSPAPLSALCAPDSAHEHVTEGQTRLVHHGPEGLARHCEHVLDAHRLRPLAVSTLLADDDLVCVRVEPAAERGGIVWDVVFRFADRRIVHSFGVLVVEAPAPVAAVPPHLVANALSRR